jgi:hypothetical protein
MPILNGAIFIGLIVIINIILVDILEINGQVYRVLLSCVVTSFPSFTSTFSYMFISCKDIFALLCAVAACYFYCRNYKYRMLVSGFLLICSLSIYQVYVAVAGSLFILCLMKRILKSDCNVKNLVIETIKFFMLLLMSCIIYLVITVVILNIFDLQFGTLATGKFNYSNIFHNIFTAYKHFFGFFVPGYSEGFIPTKVSLLAHYILLFIVAIMTIKKIFCIEKPKRILLILFGIIFPLVINCMYLLFIPYSLSTMELMSFICVYLYMIMIIEISIPEKDDLNLIQVTAVSVNSKKIDFAQCIIALCFVAIVGSNVFIANKMFLQLHMVYENMFSYYSSVISAIEQTPGFEQSSKVAFIGKAEANHSLDEFYDEQIEGVDYSLLNSYARNDFLEYYMGFNVNFAAADEIEKLETDERVIEMSVFPYYGSACKIDDYIVVKLGEVVSEARD